MDIVPYPQSFTSAWQTGYGLQPIPTTQTDIIFSTVYLDTIFLSNNTAAPITVWVFDRRDPTQGAQGAIVPGTQVDANQVVPLSLQGITAANGVAWIASADGLSGWMQGRR